MPTIGPWMCANGQCRQVLPAGTRQCTHCGTFAPDIELVGVAGRYRVGSLKAAGGCGVVHEGWTLAPPVQKVAIKTINLKALGLTPNSADYQRALQDVQREGEVLQQLSRAGRSGLPAFLDAFVDQPTGAHCLVMQFIEGENMRDHVRKLPDGLAQVDVLRYAEQVSKTLALLEGSDIVHRDLTPVNLILNPDHSEVTLVDFGGARSMVNTATTQTIHKAGYTPTEQYRGHPTPKSDVYAFGATLFYLLTGKEPKEFPGRLPKADTVQHSARGRFAGGLVDLIYHCTEDDPQQRPGANDITAQLHLVRQHLGPSAGPTQTGRSGPSWPVPSGSLLGPPTPASADLGATTRLAPSRLPMSGNTTLINVAAPVPAPAGSPVPAVLSRRLLAFLIDSVLVVVLGGASLAVPTLQGAQRDLLFLFLVLAYFWLLAWLRGQTLGMRVLGLRLVDDQGNRLGSGLALVRTASMLVSLIVLLAGFWWALLDAERLTWHDHISGTRIIRG